MRHYELRICQEQRTHEVEITISPKYTIHCAIYYTFRENHRFRIFKITPVPYRSHKHSKKQVKILKGSLFKLLYLIRKRLISYKLFVLYYEYLTIATGFQKNYTLEIDFHKLLSRAKRVTNEIPQSPSRISKRLIRRIFYRMFVKRINNFLSRCSIQ